MTRQEIKFDNDLKQKAIAWIMAKGLGVVVLVAWIISLQHDIREVKTQMHDLQTGALKENTEALRSNERTMYELSMRNSLLQSNNKKELPFNP